MNIVHVIWYMQWYWIIDWFYCLRLFIHKAWRLWSCNFDFISDYTYNNVQCKLSGFNMFNWIIVLFFIATIHLGALWNIKGTLPMYCILSLPSPPLLSKSHIGILCLILIGGEVDIGSFGGEGVISHVFIYLIESVAFTVLFFCFSLSIINQCNNY